MKTAGEMKAAVPLPTLWSWALMTDDGGTAFLPQRDLAFVSEGRVTFLNNPLTVQGGVLPARPRAALVTCRRREHLWRRGERLVRRKDRKRAKTKANSYCKTATGSCKTWPRILNLFSVPCSDSSNSDQLRIGFFFFFLSQI